MQTVQPYRDGLNFARAWLADPFRIGAILPSGPALARLIVREIEPKNGPGLELGPGTGVFTQALLDRGVTAENLAVVEYDDVFASLLSKRFPDIRVIRADAARLSRHSELHDARFSAVISGLPLLSMSLRNVVMILEGAFRYMQPTGNFYQFTYGPVCPVPVAVMDRLDLKARVVGRTCRNIPPATVYAIGRTNWDDR